MPVSMKGATYRYNAQLTLINIRENKRSIINILKITGYE